mmetsp:Transcript_6159/g.15782  ORF Transcript_6159/g.15782 Transcript_6159/m.15782 type:complete len:292 (-) Transcript_6159:64-939(-)
MPDMDEGTADMHQDEKDLGEAAPAAGPGDLIGELKDLITRDEASMGFKLKYDKKGFKVWGRSVKGDPAKMIKLSGRLPVSADVLFDTVMDCEYRMHWDASCRRSATLYRVGPASTIEYFHAKMPKPVRDRDSVARLQWVEEDGVFFLVQRSVNFKAAPVTKGAIRGILSISGYRVVPIGPDLCDVTYLSQSDPKGSLPKVVVNYISTSLAPKTMTSLSKAAQGYEAWKSKQKDAEYKPWRRHQQLLQLPCYSPMEHGELVDAVEGLRPLGAGCADDDEGADVGSDPGAPLS